MSDEASSVATLADDTALERELHGWFGEPWQSDICYDEQGRLRDDARIPVPVGLECLDCGEVFDAADRGSVVPVLTATGAELHFRHAECTLREEIGSVAHLEGRCACRGGNAGDEGRSRREEALAVWAWVAEHGLPATA